jgi:hypothetical protein
MESNLRQIVAAAALYDHPLIFSNFTGCTSRSWTSSRKHIPSGTRATSKILARLRLVARMPRACAYEIGELELLRLRAMSQQTLGSKFSMKDFKHRCADR